jgi:lysine 2,3-aminomutase
MSFNFRPHYPKGPYEGLDLAVWRDWKWQLKNSLKSVSDFAKIYNLTATEKAGFESSQGLFQIRSTPYYATLGSRDEPRDPVRLIQTPDYKEMDSRFQEMVDPLAEVKNSVSSRLIHRYSDRVLFLVTDFCSVYCRFCTRKRFTGQNLSLLSSGEYEEALTYIRSHPGVREVILSGGDPLTLSDENLDRILFDLRQIPHVEIIRIGSRMTVVNPFRVTDDLVTVLKRHKPVYFMNHFNHPNEITGDTAVALEKLADGGVPLMNQMVLLNGINNHAAIVQALSRRLLYLRVKPYYMFQCDPSKGTDHLRTSIEDSQEIQRELWGHLSGLAMPQLSVDIPNGGGKASLVPNFVESRSSNVWKFKGFDGIEHTYVDPLPEAIQKPIVDEEFAAEWARVRGSKT